MVTLIVRLVWLVTEIAAVIHVTIDFHLGFWLGFLLFDVVTSLMAIAYGVTNLAAKKAA